MIQSKYSSKISDLEAGLDIDQSKIRSSPNTQLKIKINKIAQAQIKVRQDLD